MGWELGPVLPLEWLGQAEAGLPLRSDESGSKSQLCHLLPGDLRELTYLSGTRFGWAFSK